MPLEPFIRALYLAGEVAIVFETYLKGGRGDELIRTEL